MKCIIGFILCVVYIIKEGENLKEKINDLKLFCRIKLETCIVKYGK